MGKIYIYPVWLRLWHLFNALLFLFLIITGLSMQYSSPEIPFIRFDIAVVIHNISGILLTANYTIIILGNFFTKNGKYYRINWKKTKDRIMVQFRYYTIGIFKGEHTPYPVTEKRKFNPLQKVSYLTVVYVLMPFIFLTGWALLFPDLIPLKKIFGTSSIHFTDLVHIVVGFVLSLFMIIHVYMCTLAYPPGSGFRSMINGYHETEH